MSIITSNRFVHSTEKRKPLVLILQVKQIEKQPANKNVLPSTSNRMTDVARFLLVKRKCQHFPHCPPFTKHCFVKMFLLTNTNNSMTNPHLRPKMKIKLNESGPFLQREKQVTRQEEDREASTESCHPGNKALGLPCFTNCRLREDACFLDASFN